MTRLHTQLDLPDPLTLRPAAEEDSPVLRRLWLVFSHHMSQFTGELPTRHGEYRSERLDRALDPLQPDWAAWLATAGQHPIGFAVTRAMNKPTHVLNSFFLVAPVRGRGLGLRFANAVVMASPGAWTVAYQEENHAAAAFWPRVAQTFDPDWRREAPATPDRPDLPPDTWVTFMAG